MAGTAGMCTPEQDAILSKYYHIFFKEPKIDANAASALPGCLKDALN